MIVLSQDKKETLPYKEMLQMLRHWALITQLEQHTDKNSFRSVFLVDTAP